MLERYLLFLSPGHKNDPPSCFIKALWLKQQMKGNSMKYRNVRLLLIVATIATSMALSPTAHAQGTAFIYAGQLSDGNGPANGTYDLMFTLYGTSTGGSAIAGPETQAATVVHNGAYTVVLDLGGTFDGSARWLEIAAQTNGGTGFVTLSPRQPVFTVPYAIMANSASNLLGSLPAAQLSGTVPLAQLPAGILTNNAAGVSLQGYFNGFYSGDGQYLINLDPLSLRSGTVGASLYFTNEYNFFHGSFNGYHSGDGQYLTNLDPLALRSGTVGASLYFTNEYNFFRGSFSGYHSGDGQYLINLDPLALRSGTVGAS
ncbi:MAG: hypothetical protein C5B50_22765, partial [Verrucomicrobia bacterium]